MSAGTDGRDHNGPDAGVPARMTRRSRPAPRVAYRESLHTPWWWYVVAGIVAAILAAEFHTGGLPVTFWVPYVVLIPVSFAVVFWAGRGRVEVVDGELRVRGAHLPLDYVSGAVTLGEQTLRRVVGREGDPSAFVQIRPWIRTGVQVWVDDADDPTPYWVVSSRHPRELVAAVRSAL